MNQEKKCIRCYKPKYGNEDALCRGCNIEKIKKQEKRQRTQNYKKYGIKETDVERNLRIKAEKKEQAKAEQRKKLGQEKNVEAKSEPYLDFSGLSNIHRTELVTDKNGHIIFQPSLDSMNEDYEEDDAIYDFDEFYYEDDN